MSILKFYIALIFIILTYSNISHANNVKNSAVVFMYHKFDVPKYPSTNIRPEQFEEHLNEFSKTKYNVLPLEYIIDTIIIIYYAFNLVFAKKKNPAFRRL